MAAAVIYANTGQWARLVGYGADGQVDLGEDDIAS